MNIDSEEDDEFFLDHLDKFKEKTLVQLSSQAGDEEPTKLKKKFVPNYDVDGVTKVILNESNQTGVGVSIGTEVTGERPWKVVKKESLFDDISLFGEDSPFFPFRSDLEANPAEEILLGYIADDANDHDEFYLCLTPEARTHCEYQAEKWCKKQGKKLEKTVCKTIKTWQSLGSEKHVDEAILKSGRSLIRIAIKSKFPKRCLFAKSHDSTAEDVLDSELVPIKHDFKNITRRRIDFAVQAIPVTVSSEAQTVLKFPQNVWTQCNVDENEFDIEKIDLTPTVAAAVVVENLNKNVEESESKENEGMQENGENIEENVAEEEGKPPSVDTRFDSLNEKALKLLDMVKFNSTINIYKIDYADLERDRFEFKNIEDMHIEEIFCFRNVKTKGKIVSSVSWHPMWSGILAVAYTDITHYVIVPIPKETDKIQKDIYGYNAVLIWSLDDSLSPKLYLESVREVRTVSFCPFRENLLIGGCTNGQIVLWNLKNKLNQVEKVEVLTKDQERHRNALYSQINWPKNLENKSYIRPIIVSDLRKSHLFDVTAIWWLHPDIEINVYGKLLTPNEDDPPSLQFMSISLDGSILIWNLKDVKTEEGDLKDVNLEPVYKIMAGSQDRIPLTSLVYIDLEIEYTLDKLDEISGRKLYKNKVQPFKVEQDPLAIWLSSLYGEFFKISWCGQEEDIDRAVTAEPGKYINGAKIHDSSIACIVKNPFCEKIFATVGGKVFAIWTDADLQRPLFWKKMSYCLTCATWSTYRPNQIFITTDGGNVDIWDFMHRSDAPIVSQVISGSALLGIYMDKYPNDNGIVAVSDANGSLHIFRMSKSLIERKKDDVENMNIFIERESAAKNQYHDWEKSWYAKNAEILEKNKKDEIVRQRERDRRMKIDARKEQDRREQEEARLKLEKKKVLTPEERWEKMQWAHAIDTIQEKKRLDKMELLKRVRPLQVLDEYKMRRQVKYVEALKSQQKIFDEIVAISYPEIVPKPVELVKLTPIEEIKEATRRILEDYERTAEHARKFIADNPFKDTFEWQTTMMEGKKRRWALNTGRINKEATDKV